MAKHSRALHFRTGSSTDDVTLYTTLGEVVDPTLVNQDNTTGGITLYTAGTDTGYPAIRVRDGNDTVYGALCAPSDMRATNLRVLHNGTTYAAASASSLDAYGVCYFQENGAWVWRRVDENGNPLTSNPNFNAIAPWSGIETVVIDGQTMVKIPKFYVKADTIASGTYAGAKARWVCASKKDGYHIHPAFVRNGFVMDCFYVGAYEASIDPNDNKYGSIANATPDYSVQCSSWKATAEARNTDANNPLKRGWSCQDIYTVAAINYLLLIELGTPDAQTAIGAGNVTSGGVMPTGTTNAIYRGIHEWWGNCWEYEHGAYYEVNSSSGSCTILRNTRDSTTSAPYGWSVWVGIDPGGYIGTLTDYYSTNIDYNDIFHGSTRIVAGESSVIPDMVATLGSGRSAKYSVVRGGRYDSEQLAGAFAYSLAGWDGASACRIIKDGEKTSEAAPNR